MSKEIATRSESEMAAFNDVFNVGDLSGDLMQGAGTGGFQTVSIRGSKFRVKSSGEESVIVNEDGEPCPSIEVVLLKANKAISKIYYAGKYSEGDDAAPSCMSVDGVTPDPSSEDVQNKDCATCKHNQWGSRITESGKKAKVCSDSRRVAVWLMTPAPEGFDETEPMLLRIPAASLADLATYGNKMAQKNYPYNRLVTRLAFDVDASYPKLTFRPVRPLNEGEEDEVVRMFTSDTTENILSMHPATVVEQESSGEVEEKAQDAVPEQEPEDEFAFEDAAPAKKAAPKKVAKKRAAKKAPVKQAAPVEQESNDGLDAELDSIIGDLESLS